MQTRRSVAVLVGVMLVSALSAAGAAVPAQDSAVVELVQLPVQKEVLPALAVPDAVNVFALEAISVSNHALELTAVRLALNSFQPVPALLAERGSRTTSLRASRMSSAIRHLARQRHTWRNPATSDGFRTSGVRDRCSRGGDRHCASLRPLLFLLLTAGWHAVLFGVDQK